VPSPTPYPSGCAGTHDIGLVAGISIRDMQHAMRHADPGTTKRYDVAKANLDRHAAHAVAAYLAGMSSGQRAAGPGATTNPTVHLCAASSRRCGGAGRREQVTDVRCRQVLPSQQAVANHEWKGTPC
jgi:hypothetical protein